MTSAVPQVSAAAHPPRWIRKALEDFDRTAGLLRGFLRERYGEPGATALVLAARERYAEILPRMERVKGRRGLVLNRFLDITAQELAVYQAVEARGGTASEAWELCHRGLRLRIQRIPAWKRRLRSWLLFSRLSRFVIRKRAAAAPLRAGDFETRSVVGDGERFDFGVDYLRCGNLELARKLGAEAFAPYVCMSDVALSDAFGWGLVRTQTLADGCSHCDFRFKQGGPTRISSKTAEVQATIDGIARQEAGGAEPAVGGAHPNVAVLERFDPADVPGTIDAFSEDAVFHFYNPLLPDVQGDYVGRKGILDFFGRIAELTNGTFEVHPVSVTPVGDELLVVHTRNTMRIGDQPIATDVVVVWRIVDGRIAEVWDIPSVHSLGP